MEELVLQRLFLDSSDRFLVWEANRLSVLGDKGFSVFGATLLGARRFSVFEANRPPLLGTIRLSVFETNRLSFLGGNGLSVPKANGLSLLEAKRLSVLEANRFLARRIVILEYFQSPFALVRLQTGSKLRASARSPNCWSVNVNSLQARAAYIVAREEQRTSACSAHGLRRVCMSKLSPVMTERLKTLDDGKTRPPASFSCRGTCAQ